MRQSEADISNVFDDVRYNKMPLNAFRIWLDDILAHEHAEGYSIGYDEGHFDGVEQAE